MLGSLFQLVPPTILSSAFSTSNELPRSGPENVERTDKGKGKARAVDSGDTNQHGSESEPMEDEALADAIREAITASRRTGSRVRSPDEAGPSGTFNPPLTSDIAPPPSDSTLLSRTHPSGSDSEQAEIDHAIIVSSIEHIENTLHTLRVNFVFPTRLDCHLPSNSDSHVSSTSATDEDTNGYITAYLPTTPANSTVLNFVRELRGLLHQLDHVNSNNDTEVESMKEKVVGAINRVLEDVESEVEEAIGKWISLKTTGINLVRQ